MSIRFVLFVSLFDSSSGVSFRQLLNTYTSGEKPSSVEKPSVRKGFMQARVQAKDEENTTAGRVCSGDDVVANKGCSGRSSIVGRVRRSSMSVERLGGSRWASRKMRKAAARSGGSRFGRNNFVGGYDKDGNKRWWGGLYDIDGYDKNGFRGGRPAKTPEEIENEKEAAEVLKKAQEYAKAQALAVGNSQKGGRVDANGQPIQFQQGEEALVDANGQPIQQEGAASQSGGFWR